MMPAPNRCEICGEPTERPVNMCSACLVDYDRRAHDVGDVMEALRWAARRARWYAERRAARNARQAVERDTRRARR